MAAKERGERKGKGLLFLLPDPSRRKKGSFSFDQNRKMKGIKKKGEGDFLFLGRNVRESAWAV